jgi:serine/threonine-protein kinase ATR
LHNLVNRANVCQSALCLWTAPDSWPVAVTDVRKELCTNAFGAFPNPQILEVATAVLKTFRALNFDEEDDRPAKRRKTLPESSEDVNESIYRQMVVKLSGSTQDSPVLNLSNLHNIIQ